jgi:hypothetical protein
MKGTFFYQYDHALSKPMIIPIEENHNIEEFMCVDLFDSSSHYCNLFEAIALSQNIASSNQAPNIIIDVMSDSSSSIVYVIFQIGVPLSVFLKQYLPQATGIVSFATLLLSAPLLLHV